MLVSGSFTLEVMSICILRPNRLNDEDTDISNLIQLSQADGAAGGAQSCDLWEDQWDDGDVEDDVGKQRTYVTFPDNGERGGSRVGKDSLGRKRTPKSLTPCNSDLVSFFALPLSPRCILKAKVGTL